MNDGRRIALQGAADGRDIAVDLGMGPELHIAQHCSRIAVDLAVDVGVAENGDGTVVYLSGDPGVAEDRDHVAGLAVAGRGSEYGYDGVGLFSARPVRIAADVDHIVIVLIVVVPVAMAMAFERVLPVGVPVRLIGVI